jgi:hypothetical protein
MGNPLFEAAKEVLRDLGHDPVEIDFETSQALKAVSREEDQRLLGQDLATPGEIQRRNSVIPPGAEQRVLDYGPSCLL